MSPPTSFDLCPLLRPLCTALIIRMGIYYIMSRKILSVCQPPEASGEPGPARRTRSLESRQLPVPRRSLRVTTADSGGVAAIRPTCALRLCASLPMRSGLGSGHNRDGLRLGGGSHRSIASPITATPPRRPLPQHRLAAPRALIAGRTEEGCAAPLMRGRFTAHGAAASRPLVTHASLRCSVPPRGRSRPPLGR